MASTKAINAPDESDKRHQTKALNPINKQTQMKKNIINILTILCVTLLFVSCDSGSDDGTVGNWFAAIVFLLACMKGGK